MATKKSTKSTKKPAKPVKVVKKVAAKKAVEKPKVVEPVVTHQAVEATTPDEVVNGSDEPVITVTVAESEPEPVVEPKPANDADLIKRAWHNVKDAADPEFDQCVGTFQTDLVYYAEAVFKSGTASTSDTPLARFEREVLKLKGE